MKIYIITEGMANMGHEFSIRCACLQKEIAEKFVEAFPHSGLYITPLEVIDAWTHDLNPNLNLSGT